MRCKGWKVGVEANGRIYIYIYIYIYINNCGIKISCV